MKTRGSERRRKQGNNKFEGNFYTSSVESKSLFKLDNEPTKSTRDERNVRVGIQTCIFNSRGSVEYTS